MEGLLIGIFVVMMIFLFLAGMFIFPELFGISKNKNPNNSQNDDSEQAKNNT